MCQVDLLCSALSVGGVLSSEKDDSQSRAAADGNKELQKAKLFSKYVDSRSSHQLGVLGICSVALEDKQHGKKVLQCKPEYSVALAWREVISV